MNPSAEDIKDVLVLNSIGTFAATTGWAIYIGDLPDDPNSVIALRDAGGTPEDGICLNFNQFGREVLEVYVRDTDYSTAWRKIKEIESTINRTKMWVGQVRYTLIYRQDLAVFIGYDETRRSIWRQRYGILRQIGSSSSASGSSSSSSGT